ncbi:MAG: biotin/lipoyl-binding protein, partial [Planctomycetota bacterium]
VEYFGMHDKAKVNATINSLMPPIRSAFNNSDEFSGLPLLRLMKWLRQIKEQVYPDKLSRTAVVGFIALATIFSSFVFKTDLMIDVKGQLVPELQRHVFVPFDAYVEEVLVADKSEVEKGQPLAILSSSEFELKINELQNEIAAANQKLESTRLVLVRAGNEDRDSLSISQLTADIKKQQLSIENLNESLTWYLERSAQLTILSPISGTVADRDLRTSLLDRPVQAGDQLMTVVDTNSQWEIQFDVPDREFGYLLHHAKNTASDFSGWDVQYRHQSDLGRTYQSSTSSYEQQSFINKDGEVFVRLLLPVTHRNEVDRRVGESVSGQIYCGRYSVWYVWTRDIRDFLRANFIWTSS